MWRAPPVWLMFTEDGPDTVSWRRSFEMTMSDPAVRPVPAVSVILPVYNARRFVVEAMRSILDQTFTDFEFIVIDDGSTDDSFRIVKEAAAGDPRLRLVRQENQGVSAAANRGMELARGEFLARMDADDISLPTRLEKQVAFLRGHPDHVLVGSRVLFIDEAGLPLFEMPGLKFTHEEIDAGMLAVEWTILQPAVMMRAAAVRKVGGYRRDLRIHEDHDLFLRLAEVGKVANLPEVLLKYRQHPVSAVSVYADEHVRAFESVLQDAWKRRRLPGSIPEVRPHPNDPLRDLKRKRLWAWQSLKAGHLQTARKYAWAGLREAPFDLESWKVLYCALRGH